jgi:hypothetical protein
MPSPNIPDPDKIPNMSLDDAAAPPPARAEDAASSYQTTPPPPVPDTAPAPLSKPSEPTAPNWQEGDAVLAPWEPCFLYPGAIREIKVDEARGDQALIDFDDGGQGWVFLYSLCPFEFKVGQEVHNRRRTDNLYAPARIIDVEGEEVHLRYDDGRTEWTPTGSLRVPCVENGPGAMGTQLAPWQTPPPPQSSGNGFPTWVIWIGLVILLTIVRMACREMGRN